jgi:hypothetical protein
MLGIPLGFETPEGVRRRPTANNSNSKNRKNRKGSNNMAGITKAERERRDALYTLGLKECKACEEPQALREYSPRADGYRGLNGTCRTCKHAVDADYRRRTPDYQAERQRDWREANRAAWLAISRRRQERERWAAA